MKLRIALFFSLLVAFASWGQKKEKIKLEKGLYANIITDKGDILIHLYPEKAPLTVANFVGLAEGDLTVFDSIEHKDPFYDGLIFHRVVGNFVIQGGDPKGDGTGGPGYEFWNETSNDLTHITGAVAMANAGPNTNGSQFYITLGETHHLDGNYSIFGQVIKGQDVVGNIARGDTIQHVEIIKKGLKYKWFYNPTKLFKSEYERLKKIYKAEELKQEKLDALNKVRLVEAKSRSEEEYKEYFYDIVKKIEPEAIQTESGLVYVIQQEGQGETIQRGDSVQVHYNGKFIYGGTFDSSYKRKKPFAIKYLYTGLIKGFNEGIGLAKKGTKINVYIPYFLAYGKRGRRPMIPAYSDLIFELEIISVNKVNKE